MKKQKKSSYTSKTEKYNEYLQSLDAANGYDDRIEESEDEFDNLGYDDEDFPVI